MRRILKTLQKREWFFVLITFIFIIAQVWLDLRLPEYMSEITTLVQTEGSQMGDILQAGGLMLACAIGALFFTFCVGFFAAQIAATVAMRLREEVYDKTVSFSMADINKFSTGSLITRSTNDITQIQTFVALGYIAIIRAPLTAIWAIMKISSKNAEFTNITLITVLSLVIVLAGILVISVPKSKIIQRLTDKLNTLVREHLTGIRVVRAYNAEKFQEDKFSIANENVANTNIFVNRATALMQPYMTFIMSALTLFIYWVGAYLISSAGAMDKLTIFSDMVVFSSYAMQIIGAFMMLTMTTLMLPRVIVSLGRINEVLDYENSINDGNVTTSKSSYGKPSIEFRNVDFAYPDGDEKVLRNVNFTVNKGETIAFIGSTGSGKSTIVNLIMRFYDVTSGEILIDGINIQDYTQKALREKLGLVSQKAIIFSGDISSNIAFGIGEDISAKDLKEAVSIAQADDFVNKVGVNGAVSQSGLNLSGGQKQRLSIARAIYKKSEIYIFDDCFSALDYKTDKNLRKQLNEETAGATKLMVAQRISTVKDADQIVVLEDGMIAGIGKHNELLKNCEIYREIAESQLSKEELGYE